jgi:hypothetical protein
MAGGKFLHLFASATPLQQAMYMLAMAWAHLWMLTLTIPKMKKLVGDVKGEERAKLSGGQRRGGVLFRQGALEPVLHRSEFPSTSRRNRVALGGETAVISAGPEIFSPARSSSKPRKNHGRGRRGDAPLSPFISISLVDHTPS